MSTKQFFLDVTEEDKLFCFLENEVKDNTWVICFHGLFQDKSESWFLLSKLAHGLVTLGVSVCRYDARGCGDSSGVLLDVLPADFRNDALYIIEYIQKEYLPAKIVLVGVGFGCITALQTAKEKEVSQVVLLNPSLRPLLDYEKAFKPEALAFLQEHRYVEVTEETIVYEWLEHLHESGSQYWNALGQCIGIELLEELRSVNLLELLKGNKNVNWYAVISKEKEEDIQLCSELITQGYTGKVEIIESNPLFTNPKIQTEVVEKIMGWVRNNV